MNGRKPSYKCKRFENDKWKVLGWIYADSQDEASKLAREKWGRVDSCYGDVYDSLPDTKEAK